MTADAAVRGIRELDAEAPLARGEFTADMPSVLPLTDAPMTRGSGLLSPAAAAVFMSAGTIIVASNAQLPRRTRL